MRFLLVAALFACMQVNVSTYAQGITLRLRHAPVSVLFDTLNKMVPCEFTFCTCDTRYSVVDLDVHNATFQQLLDTAFKDLRLQYTLNKTRKEVYSVTINRNDSLPLKGKIIDDKGEPLEGVKVSVRHTVNLTRTDSCGAFLLSNVADADTLDISGANVRNHHLPVWGKIYLELHIPRYIRPLESTTVSGHYNNGYQQLKAAISTGSIATADHSTLNRVVAINILDHFAGQISGLTTGGPGNPLGISIHNRNTFNSPGTPLFVWDNFVYFGNAGDVNPSDIESATLLKDAVAAGVWGGFSGNGVIVITSRNGQYNQPMTVTAAINTTVIGKPDLFYQPRMSSASYIGAETYLFGQHYYDGFFSDPTYPITPVVDLLRKKRDGGAPADVDGQISQLAGHNSLTDMRKYFYRNNFIQQYHISVEGGGANSKYYLALGHDQDPTTLVRNKYGRTTLHAVYTFQPIFQKLEIATTFHFATVDNLNNNSGTIPVAYPYALLADASGHALAVNYKYNPAYIDTAGGGLLQDWHYRPLDELRLSNNHSGRNNGHLQMTVKYAISSRLSLTVLYRFMLGQSYAHDQYSKDGFFVRDLANLFAEQNGNRIVLPVPVQDILISSDTNYTAHNLRAQLNFTPFCKNNQLTMMAGAELSDLSTTGQTRRIYGYDGKVSSALMDLVHYYPTYITGNPERIPTDDSFLGLFNRYVSIFSNTSFTFRRIYNFYGAFRMDASNITGVGSQQQWAPFWSVGASRELIRSSHQKSKHPPLLKARASFGCNGNVSNRTANLVIETLSNNVYGSSQSGIANAPDPSLTWEKTYILNTGLDFSFLQDSLRTHGRIYGSLDLYSKRSIHLLASDTLAPSSGVPFFLDNTGGITGSGLDLVLNTINTTHDLKWTSTLLFSVARDRVSHYRYQPGSPAYYVSGNYPMTGRPVAALISYRWGGLDPLHGDPMGYVDHQPMNYSSVMNDPKGDIHYSGSYQPIVYGSILNTFQWKQFCLSTRINFKAAYSFRRTSMDYNGFITGLYPGHRDYDKRWQFPGDEKKTSVPSFPVVNDPNRDVFYLNSDVLVTRGDQIRWQDCRLSYEWVNKNKRLLPLGVVTFYAYVNNLGIIWKANHYGIDPDAAGYGDLRARKSWTLGVQIDFYKSK